MNNDNVLFWYEDGFLYGQYSTRDPKDTDDDGTPIWIRKTEASGLDDYYAKKRLKAKLCAAYDNWVRHEKYN